MKKKIVILSCRGGGGHISAASAIKSYLESAYTVIIKDALGDILAPIDPTYYVTFKRKTGQDIYNFLLRHNQKRLTNILYKLGNVIIQRKKDTITKIFIHYFQQEKPDLIISVIPIINNTIFAAAQHQDIPYILVPTDLDATTFITNLHLPQSNGPTLCLGFDYPELRRTINSDFIHDNATTVTGFPLGPQFFEKKNKKILKKKLSIEGSKPIILLMMGATGSSAIISYIRSLSKVKIPFHLLACTGRNTSLQKKIHTMKLPEHIGLTVVDTSHDISDMMAIADFCITKPGSVTFAEALYMNLPMLIDKTTSVLLWEALNLEFLNHHNLGMIITSFKKVPDMATWLLSSREILAVMKKNIAELQKKHFGSHLTTIVYNKLNQCNKLKIHQDISNQKNNSQNECIIDR